MEARHKAIIDAAYELKLKLVNKDGNLDVKTDLHIENFNQKLYTLAVALEILKDGENSTLDKTNSKSIHQYVIALDYLLELFKKLYPDSFDKIENIILEILGKSYSERKYTLDKNAKRESLDIAMKEAQKKIKNL